MLNSWASIRPAWAEINLDNLRHNLQEVRKITLPSAGICAVVKADGYGHGAVEIAKEAASFGVSYIGVALLDEALELRENGITNPILILGFTPENQFDTIVRYNITQTVYDLRSAIALSEAALKQNKKARIHIKIDTGMNRIGFFSDKASLSSIKKILSLTGLETEGIFTHFACADISDRHATDKQFKMFMEMVKTIKNSGYSIPIIHAANSAGILNFPNTHMDMVRPGIILYGMYPSHEAKKDGISLKPLMSLKTRVSHVKMLHRGAPVSYGGTFITQRQSLIATLPIGYGDGYSRLLSSKSQVIIKGQRAPIVGRICMDQCMVDVTDIKGDVRTGEEVVLVGEDGGEIISTEEIAGIMGTINYEVTCGISKRVPRVYIMDGKIRRILNLLVK